MNGKSFKGLRQINGCDNMSRQKLDLDSYMSGKPSKPDLSSKPEYKRATYIVNQEYIEKIKSIPDKSVEPG